MFGVNGYVAQPLIDKVVSMNLRGKFNMTGQNRFYKRDIPGYTQAIGNNPYTSHSPTGYVAASAGGRLNYILNEQNSFYLDHEFNYQNLGSLNTSGSQITAIRDYFKYNTVLNHDANYDFGDFNTYFQFADTQQISRSGVPIGGNLWRGYPNRSSMQDNKVAIVNSTWFQDYDFQNAGTLMANAGIYYMYEQFEARPRASTHQNQVAIFGEAEYMPVDLVSTTLGLRVNYYNYVETNKVTPNPRFYLNLNPTDFFTIKAGETSGMSIPQMSRLYEGYVESTSGSSTIHTYGNKDLEAEKSWNYELSVIFDTNPFYITLTGFYTDFRDKVNSVDYLQGNIVPGYGACGASTCSLYQNVDKALSTGIEFTLQMKRIYGIGLDTSYAYTFTKRLSGDDKGAALNNIPRHNLSAKLSYQIGTFETYLRYVGKYDTPTGLAHTANSGVGAYYKDMHIVDLGVNYRFNKTWSAGLVVNNLFNTSFVDYVATENGTRYTNLYQRMIPSRNYWVSLKAEF